MSCQLFTVVVIILAFQLKINAQSINVTWWWANGNNDCSDGGAQVSIIGAFPPYQVTWIAQPNGEVVSTVQTSSTYPQIHDLSAGNYTVQVTDALCGSAEQDFFVYCDGFFITNIVHHYGNSPDCEGGTLQTFGHNGQSPYNIEVKFCSPPGFWDPIWYGHTITDLPGGEYCVTVTDASGQIATAGPILINCPCPEPPNFNADISAHCGINNPGSITLSWDPVEWSSEGYTATWYGPNGSTHFGFSWPDVPYSGVYILEVSDNLTCAFSESYTIPGSEIFVIDNFSDANTIPGDGFIEIDAFTVPGSDISYLWSTGESSASIYNLGEKNYTVTISSSDGCVLIKEYHLEYIDCDDTNIQVSVDFSEVSPCEYGNLGSLDVSIDGGSPPWTVYFGKLPFGSDYPTWDQIFTTTEASNKISGINESTVYSLVVVDNQGNCMSDEFFVPCDCRLFEPNFYMQDPCRQDFLRATRFVFDGRVYDGYYNEMSTAEYEYYLSYLPEIISFEIEWFDDTRTTLDLEVDLTMQRPDPWRVVNVNGDTRKKITSGMPNGLYCATITDMFGCSYTDCETQGNPPVKCIGEGYITLSQVFQEFFNETQPNVANEPVTVGCFECEWCGSLDDCESNCEYFMWEYGAPRPGLSKYEVILEGPNTNSPCEGLAFLCPGDPERILYTIPDWTFYTEFVDYTDLHNDGSNCWYDCGCLYPAGVFPNIDYPLWIETRLYTAGEECEPIDPPDIPCSIIPMEPLGPPQASPYECLYLFQCSQNGQLVGEPWPESMAQAECANFNQETGQWDLVQICDHTNLITNTLLTNVNPDDYFLCPDRFEYPFDSPEKVLLRGQEMNITSQNKVQTPESSLFNFILFPNPALDVINLDFSSYRNIDFEVQIDMYYINGVLINSGMMPVLDGTIQLDVSDLPSGLYYIRVSSEREGAVVKPFVRM